ncbi:MAG: protein kinase [Lachnospiraceae bacterium]|nr:protein kinase [Lachnospiraceae bacterium]
MSVIRDFIKNLNHHGQMADNASKGNMPAYEYCPRCDANLTYQKGYSNDLLYWICKGCGEVLINPEIDTDSDITWFCDGCGELLNIQQGFREDCGEWKCSLCGYVNKIDKGEIYGSEDEYRAELRNPYRGLSDSDILELSMYEDVSEIDGRDNIILIRQKETGGLFLKKLLTTYNKSIYEYLLGNPVLHMPKIRALYESSNSLIVIEEYIEGQTLSDIIGKDGIGEKKAVDTAIGICAILDELHSLPEPIIHRDIKPSNIMITPEGEVYLLDMNVAKWYDPDKSDDTRYMGTKFYAAPEQVGYGMSASSAKSDIYALGILLNVMITGDLPKYHRADGEIWKIIERCISLEAENRYTAKELGKELERVKGRRPEA